ncbi:Cell division protein FtsI [Peptidoglycan synthetase] [hydrothermal vent metagenome]|uniref:beta-lactamase n=1 Tax=hydrothermal vent metagenome TaxID=652676 RepID=A0A3B1DVX4_9ZZZZ
MEESLEIEEPVAVIQQPLKNRGNRLLLLGGGIIVLMICLLQVFYSGESSTNKANQTAYFTQKVVARPGDIVDRKGRLLATSVSVKSLYLVPQNIKSPRQTARTIRTLFDIDIDWVSQAIENQQKKDKKYLWLKHRLNRKEVQQVKALGLPGNVYGFRKEYLRCYPQGELAAHLLGTCNLENAGEGGIEESYYQSLSGVDGKRLLLRKTNGGMNGEEIETKILYASQQGKTVVLTLDTEIQSFVEQGLQQITSQWNPKGCCAIMMNPQTGEILASASFPKYNPNQPVRISPSAWRDQTISFLFEPDAMLTPLVTAWGLQKGVVSKEQFSFNRQQTTKLNQNKNRYEAIKHFRLEQKTDSILIDEQSGTLLPLDQWESLSIEDFSGKPIATVTPLGLITAYATLANGGKRVSPRYVLQQMDSFDYIRNQLSATGTEEKPTLKKMGAMANQIISQENANWIATKLMVDFVNQRAGKKARLHDYSLFGYAGRSQKTLVSKANRFDEKATQKKVVCSFICGAPADNPQLLLLVVVDEPDSKNEPTPETIAAPVAAEILHQSLKYLQVPTLQNRVQAVAEKTYLLKKTNNKK